VILRKVRGVNNHHARSWKVEGTTTAMVATDRIPRVEILRTRPIEPQQCGL